VAGLSSKLLVKLKSISEPKIFEKAALISWKGEIFSTEDNRLILEDHLMDDQMIS
jgi:hypothetical protein